MSFTIEELSEKILKYPYLGLAGFYKKLEEAERDNWYINKVDIEVCALLGNSDLAKHYSDYREHKIAEKEAKRQAEVIEREQKEREAEEKRIAEIKRTISEAENNIFNQKEFKNTKVDEKSCN